MKKKKTSPKYFSSYLFQVSSFTMESLYKSHNVDHKLNINIRLTKKEFFKTVETTPNSPKSTQRQTAIEWACWSFTIISRRVDINIENTYKKIKRKKLSPNRLLNFCRVKIISLSTESHDIDENYLGEESDIKRKNSFWETQSATQLVSKHWEVKQNRLTKTYFLIQF